MALSARTVAIRRTDVPNRPPATGSLVPGELCVEMANPTRLWVGVPAVLDPTQMKLLYDSSAVGGGGSFVPIAGGTMTGFLTLSADPTANLHAATKQYVDALAAAGTAGVVTWNTRAGVVTMTSTDITGASGLLSTGGTMTGFLTLNADPTAPMHATPKQYVDAADALLQQEVDILASNLVFVGGIAVPTNTGTYTIASGIPAGALPAAAPANLGYYVIVTTGGTPPGASNIPPATYALSDWIVSDGAQWIRLPIGEGTTGYVLKTGDTMSGFLTLNADPTNVLHATTKQYTDRRVAKAGDVMTGFLTLNANPTAALHATTKQYCDANSAGVPPGTYVMVAGDTMTGALTAPALNVQSTAFHLGIDGGNPTLQWSAGNADYFDLTTGNRYFMYGGTVDMILSTGGLEVTAGMTCLGAVIGTTGLQVNGPANFNLDAGFQAGVGIRGDLAILGQGVAYNVAAPNNNYIAFGWSGVELLLYAAGVWAGTNVATQAWVLANFAPISDERVKENITPATVGLEDVKKITPISYTRDPASIYGGTAPPTEIGFSAQEMATVIPQAVFEVMIPAPGEDGGPMVEQPPVLGVIPQPIIAALVNAVKTLDARLTSLEAPAMRA